MPASGDSQADTPTDGRHLDRLLAIGAFALMLFGILIFGVLPGHGFQILAAIVAATALAGGVIAPHGSQAAFMLLWAAFGMATAIGIIGIFSLGLLYLIAAIFLLFAIIATPNRSGIALRYDMRYIMAFAIGHLFIFYLLVVFLPRF